ncbi:MAG: relaxase domain-containing protein, partial [Humibacillus sp.]|nr:relaxase domain-containing protein [Humibacillus sp.]
MSLHKLTAGDGYTYLTRQVAAADSSELGRVALADYYTEKGERPGTWLGTGLAGIAGVEVGAVVSEAQMKALFGEGRHPDADELQKAVIAAGGTVKVAIASSALGRPFAKYDDEPSAFITQVTLAYRQWNTDQGRSYDAPVPAEERSWIRSTVGRETFTEQYGRAPLDDRELAGHIARSSRPARLAVAGYDLTFSPVKSVSTLWALAAPEDSAKIEAAHEAAVKDTIAWLEREVAYTRVGAQGVRQVDVTGLVATAFTHRDSRAGDPDLHTHVAVSNKVQSAGEGKWLALDGAVLHRAVVAASERYNTRLEHEVTDRLGVTFAPTEKSLAEGKRVIREVVGVPAELIRAWSKRRAAIDVVRKELARDFQADHGRPPTPKEAVELAQQATLATREAKHEPRSLAEQRATWAAQAEDVLGGSRAVEAMLATVTTRPATKATAGGEQEEQPAEELTDTQITDLAKRALYTVQLSRARFQWAHVYAEASRLARGLDLTADLLDTTVDAVVAEALGEQRSVAIIPPEFAELTPEKSPTETATETTAKVTEGAEESADAKESAAAADTEAGGDSTGITPAGSPEKRDGGPGVEAVVEPAVLRRADGESVYVQAKSQLYTTTEILDAEAYLVTTAGEAGGRVVDETTLGLALLEQAANGVTLNPGQVQLVTEMATSGARLQLALAPAGSGKTTAMSVLSKAWTDSGGQVIGLAPSAAAAKELGDATGGQADTLARLTYSIRTGGFMPDWGESIGPETLVLIDEAGMAGTLELAMATRYVTARGGSVRLVGDDQQLAAIAAGGALRDIAEEVGAVTLSELMRFTDPAEGAATLALRAGDPEALGFYLDRGRVHQADESTVADQVFEAWMADTDAGKTCLMLASTNDIVTDLNARARAHRLATQPATNTAPAHTAADDAAADATEAETEAGERQDGQGGRWRPRWPGQANREQAEREQAAQDRARTVVLASGLEASAGDLVITRRNDRRLGITATDWVKNGDRFTVIAAHRGGQLTVRHAATERTITLPAEYVAEQVDLGYACTFHGAQGATVDTSHSALSGGETRQLLYVGMTRGREANHAYLATAGDGDPHAMIRPERIKPPTAGEAVTEVLAVDGSQRSATTEIRHQHEATTKLGRSAPRYVDALGVAATELLGPEKVAQLEAHAEKTLPGLTSEPAWEALRGELALTALDGTDPNGALTAAIESRELTTARDRAAVLHWRVTGAHPGPVGPLPWVQGIPQQLREHPTWGVYLTARVALVVTHLAQVRQAAKDLAPEAAPRWAHPILADRELLGDVLVWRAVTGVTDTNDQGTILGGPHPQVAARHHQNTLQTCIDALVAREQAGTAGTLWRPVITDLTNLGPRVLDDPYWPVLDRRLDLANAAGFDVPALLSEAAGQGPVPDEHPASALWYRL